MSDCEVNGKDDCLKSSKDNNIVPIPLFWDTEVKCSGNQPLGQGSYCEVWAVQSLTLVDKDQDAPQNANQYLRQQLADRFPPLSAKRRAEAANRSIYGRSHHDHHASSASSSSLDEDANPTKSKPRIVMKKLRSLSVRKHARAQADLDNEIRILRMLVKNPKQESHPNIIELYGVGFPRGSGGISSTIGFSAKPTFLLVRRLRSTLPGLLQKWRYQRGLEFAQALPWNVANSRRLWLERLLVIQQICEAIGFLHAHHIVYRDLKPENVGTDENNVIKLFDFGLAKELPSTAAYFPSNAQKASNSNRVPGYHSYKLTAQTGTMRYMAPETGRGEPYGQGVDVYSLAIVIYQILTLRVPFLHVRPRHFEQQVWEKGTRLPLDNHWPAALLRLLPNMWHADASSRPTAVVVAQSLHGMQQGSDSDLFPAAMVMGRK